uniref:SJCHGC03703 protein n=1 Tax=Schistosoma japonicum TaxID=6182 RepID=Q5BSN6_SCHJA|nr:SJCHGC03703 protein [Schistosoma japonicum]
MKGYCRTSKPPYIFYRPKIHNEKSKWRIEAAVRAIDGLLYILHMLFTVVCY